MRNRSDYLKAKRSEWKSKGLCSTCGSFPATGQSVRCESCINRYKTIKNSNRSSWKKLGLCIMCGVDRESNGLTRCTKCIELKKSQDEQRRLERKLKGVCVECGKNPQEPFYERCFSCQMRNRCTVRLGSGNLPVMLKKWEQQNSMCIYSNRQLQLAKASIDHIVPTSQGGDHQAENLQWVLAEVNHMKNNLSEEEFLKLIKDIYSNCKESKRWPEIFD
jgi:hypothetical protein